ncbi:helix-turn-helix domain-containing protein [Streptomyces sp. NPDC001177]
MGANAEVSVARRVVGDLLRIHRVRLDLTQKEAGERLHVSESCLGSYERAERIPPTEFLRHADEGLDARGAFLACVEMMEGEKYPPQFLGWVRLEREARVISAYETMLIPGLLQTEAYARALYESRVPAFGEEEIQRYVRARLERQTVLGREPAPHVGLLVEESVLERPVGGAEVLKGQLNHLLECARSLSHLMLQVMPTRRHTHAGLNGPMQLMVTEEGQSLVYVDAQGSVTLISEPLQVTDLFDLFGILRAQALNPWESADLIERKAAQL